MAVAKTGHVIVAFDRAIPHFESTYHDKEILSCIDSFISEEVQDKYNVFDLDLSVVGYTLNGNDPDIEDFVLPYLDSENRPVIWKQYSSPLSDIFHSWPKGEPRQMNNYSRPASMQSLAKPYCVMETAVEKESHAVDATFLLLITDEKVQGVDDDYEREWNRMMSYNHDAYTKIQDSVFGKLKRFNEIYRFKSQKRKTIVRHFHNEYVIVLYELQSAELPSIGSVSNLPSPLPIKRVRGGYTLACQVESNNPKYKIKDWAVYNSSDRLFKRDAAGKVFINSDELRDGDTLDIRMILRISDDMYGGLLLSRSNCAGMSLKQVVKIQDEAKIFGMVPLYDSFWWWFHDDVMNAVIIWDLLLLLALIAVLVYVFYRLFVVINSYHPHNEDIKLTKI